MTPVTDPVGLSDIASRLDVAAGTPQKWRTRGLFPPPAATVGGRPVWEWAVIRDWASARDTRGGRPKIR